ASSGPAPPVWASAERSRAARSAGAGAFPRNSTPPTPWCSAPPSSATSKFSAGIAMTSAARRGTDQALSETHPVVVVGLGGWVGGLAGAVEEAVVDGREVVLVVDDGVAGAVVVDAARG